MIVNWRDTLTTLLTQFQARAAKSPGLHHLLVETADNERPKLRGPSWFVSSSDDVRIVDGQPIYDKWAMSAAKGGVAINPSFREPTPTESFDEGDADRVIRDRSGVVRAVAVPMKLRYEYFCGQPSEEVTGFESLANAAAVALAGANDLAEHPFASDLTDLFRRPYGGVRYVFGDVPGVPNQFTARGWIAGVLQFDHGTLIDVPIAESAPGASHWTLLLHRLGWRRIPGSALQAGRWAWKDNVDVALEMLSQDWTHYPEQFSAQFAGISKESFYSVLGTKEAPLDVNLASVFAIQLLLADLSLHVSSAKPQRVETEDYSREAWHNLEMPDIRGATRDESNEICVPRLGVFVATEVEREAVLKKIKPPGRKRAVLRVYSGSNTCYVGRLGVTDVVVCMTAMGSVGRDASLMVVAEIIDAWNLAAVIMVGIAFGKDARKQAIGNVLVSDRIISYEPERIGPTENQERGPLSWQGRCC
jgi:hypothetical protein